MTSTDRIGPSLPASRIGRIADKRRNPEREQRQRRENKQPPDKRSDGHDHIIDELA